MNPLAEFFASNVDYSHSLAENGVEASSKRSPPTARQPKSIAVEQPGQRVCDRCIVKKVKCDMKLPACSRCLEVDSPCNYSVKKRKPGPVKGSKHARRRTSKDTSHRSSISDASSPGSRRSSEVPSSLVNQWQPESVVRHDAVPTTSIPMAIPDMSNSVLFNSPLSPLGMAPSIPTPLGIPPSHELQRTLLESFFLHIHPSIPLFHQQRLIARHEAGTISSHLLLTICVMTAKIMGMDSTWNGSSLDDCTAYILDLKVIENECAGKVPSLDNFRQACLLAFYAFHQYPGEKSWMRIGNLTRKAYQCGLHQIDFQSAGSQFDREFIIPEELEEWRYVWWCIYCLDSYSNVTAVTPFIVEVESIRTALVNTSLICSASDVTPVQIRSYLPDDTDMLWKTAKEVTTSSGEINFNMHILTTTLIREAATIHRLRKLSKSKRVKTRLADLENHFSAFRLALPTRYLSAPRNAFVNESTAEHHARLICVLHIHLARLLTYFPYNPQDDLNDWMMRWQQCLEAAEDVITIVKQWDSQFFTATDPAICFIVSLVLTLIHLHSCAADATLEFKVRMDTYKDVLVLFLEQFASAWNLPRFLILSFEQFKKIVSNSLTPTDVDRILKVSVGPINYKWLNFLSLSADFEKLESPGRMYENLFTEEWDANEWESLIPLPQA